MVRAAAKKDTKKVAGDAPKELSATINLHKRLHGVTFKNRAPRAVREIKKFAAALMHTADVRIDSDLNKYVWSCGVRNVPFRVRINLKRQRNEEDEAGEKRMYTLVELGDASEGLKGLHTEKVAAAKA